MFADGKPVKDFLLFSPAIVTHTCWGLHRGDWIRLGYLVLIKWDRDTEVMKSCVPTIRTVVKFIEYSKLS